MVSEGALNQVLLLVRLEGICLLRRKQCKGQMRLNRFQDENQGSANEALRLCFCARAGECSEQRQTQAPGGHLMRYMPAMHVNMEAVQYKGSQSTIGLIDAFKKSIPATF